MSADQTKTPVLTKTLRNGSTCAISLVPDPPWPGQETTTLSWWLLFEGQDGKVLGQMKARPYEMAEPASGLSHAIPVKHGTVIGLTKAEADQITAAIDRWVDDRKAANDEAREQHVARVRAAAPGAATWEIQDPYGVPGVGVTARIGRQMVTSLRTWSRYYREDGMTFGAADDRGYVYFAEVRRATEEEAAPLLAREAAQQHRETVVAQVETEIAVPATRPDADEEIPDLNLLKGVKLGSLVEIRKGAECLWVLRYNGADGDNWAYNNYGGYIATRVPLTPQRSELFAEARRVLEASR
ncbi:MAG TPA: hypothetical protein VGJ13_05380 [Pseudonocardiaceae bacterium]|jgi:hypothetical protein